MTSELQQMLHVTLASASGTHAVELRVPRMVDAADILNEDGPRTADALAMWLPCFVYEFVAQLDGRAMTFEWASTLAEDATFARGLLLHVRTLLDTLRERGAVYALCPRCLLWDAPVSIQAYALTVAAPLPSTFDGPILRAPWLGSKTLRAEERPRLTRAGRIRVVLPSVYLGLAGPIRDGELGEIRHQPEEFSEPEPGDEDYDIDNARTGAGWRALRRLARGFYPPLTSEAADELPLVDFLFLDLVHYLVNVAEVRADTAGRLRCPRCGTEFLPVRRDFVA